MVLKTNRQSNHMYNLNKGENKMTQSKTNANTPAPYLFYYKGRYFTAQEYQAYKQKESNNGK